MKFVRLRMAATIEGGIRLAPFVNGIFTKQGKRKSLINHVYQGFINPISLTAHAQARVSFCPRIFLDILPIQPQDGRASADAIAGDGVCVPYESVARPL
jgi:hypothetical protein